MKTTYNPSIPLHLRPLIEQNVERAAHLMPTWCHELVVFYESENPQGFALSCIPVYHYRTMHLHFYDLFFHEEDGFRILLHEIQHALFRPYTQKVEEILASFIRENELRAYFTAELRNLEEAVCEDTSYNIKKLIDAAAGL